MSTKAKFINGICQWFDSLTFERTLVAAPTHDKDDFLGKAIDTTKRWTALDTSAAGNTTPVLATNGVGGLVNLPLDATSETQLTGLTEGDVKNWAIANGLVAEFRARFTTLPTGSVVGFIGMCGTHNAALDSVAEECGFRVDGSGVITVEHDDGTNETSKVATGVTVIANQFFVGRIDFSDPANVQFFIDGNRVAPGTVFNINTVTTLQLQRCARLDKGAATTVGTLQLDYFTAFQKR